MKCLLSKPYGLLHVAAALAMQLVSAGPSNAQSEPFKIGLLTDMSGPAKDVSGKGTEIIMQMAIRDYGGKVLGRPIQLEVGDTQLKPDVGITIARRWYDDNVQAIFDVGLSSIAFAVQELAKEKKKTVVYLTTASTDITGSKCSANGIQWTLDSYSMLNGIIGETVKQMNGKWYFMTVDYAYGSLLEETSKKLIVARGGRVIGSSRHPIEATDYSSDLLKAKNSGADIIALATLPTNTANLVKQADEFGMRRRQKFVALQLQTTDASSIGLETAQGLMLAEPFYWDQNDQTRAFAGRVKEKFGKMPNAVQASAYGATMHYLRALDAVGSADNAAVLAKMKETKINDFMTKDGWIRADGRVMRSMFVFQIKSPAESKNEWDVLKQIRELKAEEAFMPPRPDVCPLVK